MFHIKKVVARIYDPTRGMMYRDLGIETVCPTTVGAKMIRDMLLEAPWDTLQSFDFGKVTSLRAVVSATDSGKRVSEFERPGRIRIAAVRTGKTVRVPGEDTILSEGDEINAIVAPDAMSEFAQMFRLDRERPAPVAASGGL
jgi:trk system potassium uptake protein TrkA